MAKNLRNPRDRAPLTSVQVTDKLDAARLFGCELKQKEIEWKTSLMTLCQD